MKMSSILRQAQSTDARALADLWCLRALVDAGGFEAAQRELSVDTCLLEALGVDHVDDDGFADTQLAATSLALALRAAEMNPHAKLADSVFGRNMQALAALAELTEVETQVLALMTMLRLDLLMSKVFSTFGQVGLHQVEAILASVLGQQLVTIREVLHPCARVVQTGLIAISAWEATTFADHFRLFGRIAHRMGAGPVDPVTLFSDQFRDAPAPTLALRDFDHLQPQVDLACSYLADSVRQRRVGVNLLIYGPPGSGKTEFTRALAQAIGAQLYEVATGDAEGDPTGAHDRLRALRLSHRLLSNKRTPTLVVFDEVEDVLGQGIDGDMATLSGPQANSSGRKGWINKMLEENPVPTLWLTNHVDSIDRAHRRRFDLVIKFESCRPVREHAIALHLAHLPVSTQWCQTAAANEDLSPAMVQKAARVVTAVRDLMPQAPIEPMLEQVLNGALSAVRACDIGGAGKLRIGAYDLDLLNADCDLRNVVTQLRSCPTPARICLYGPPGTGKTAFGHYVAQQLGKPLSVKRASDLLGSYVGQTERQLAEAFGEAARADAILVIDEVDAFLNCRSTLKHAWEVSAVNEFLVQLELFQGIFIATTNLLADFDEAALRRFDMKVGLSPLVPKQIAMLWQANLQRYGLVEDPKARASVCALRGLVPGDFATVERQSRLNPLCDAADLAKRLCAEVAFKQIGAQRRIGFV